MKYAGNEIAYKHEWYLRNKERLLQRQKLRRQIPEKRKQDNETHRLWVIHNLEKSHQYKQKNKNETRFGGNRLVVLERDKYSCRICGTKEKLVIHHLDSTENRKKMNANNSLENLLTLCRGCHSKLHAEMKI